MPEKMGGYDRNGWVVFTGISNINVYPCEVTHSITDEEHEELKNALNLLNRHTASSREEYIDSISENRLALKVKMNDLKNNMDLSRIQQPTEPDLARVQRYKVEYDKLLNTLRNNIEI